ncbi:ribulose-phosphate 3-epimerase [Candidatus Similichlamydia laticola]|uniref:Ribulose-phosphate 3-epimerase n=1 Tax=Candidatus Similichlamydia laticola TaxID=2170265 RepID=A0A369KD82_9BACT|nr:ribulose-phosphate 3-epimerase [Candidatus Similichlamydia laticola]RDB31562.1 Ribulose-phosphate 3-epimerase [Candidatus Similichlamydia laticola]
MSARHPILRVEASLLNAPLNNLKKLCCSLEKDGVDGLHLDIMDGHFVANLSFSFGPSFIEQVRSFSKLPLHIHLMTCQPQKYFPCFIQAGATALSFHYETALEEAPQLIDSLKAKGVEVGMAVSPETSLEVIKPLLSRLDRVLLMSVTPGFGGQKFMSNVLPKIHLLSNWSKSLRIQVDGGIQLKTGRICLSQGANELAIGSALFKEETPRHTFLHLLKRGEPS